MQMDDNLWQTNKVAYKRLVGGIDFVDATRVKTSSVVCFGIVLGR